MSPHVKESPTMIVPATRLFVRVGSGLLIALAVLGLWLRRADSAPQTEASATKALASEVASASDVHALARLEPATGLIVVGARPGARIERISASPGDSVAFGTVLAVLEGNEQARIAVALAEAQKALALHRKAVQREKLQLEREQSDQLQRARLGSAGQVLEARQTVGEITNLYQQLHNTLASKERFDLDSRYFEIQTQSLRDDLEVKAAQIGAELAPRQRKLEDAELGDQGPEFDVLDRQIELAKAALAQTEVRAPRQGQVLELLAHAGEVSIGPLLAMGDLSAMNAVAEVYQADVPRLHVGDPAVVPIFDESVAGTVSRIGVVVGKNQLTNLDPRALQDRRVVKVTVSLKKPQPAARFLNMDVELMITPRGGTSPETEPRASAR
jgi:HlyD family secretion protein